MRSLPPGKEVLVSVRTVRSIRQLRLYWALMNLLVEFNLFPSREAASDTVKIASGHVDMRVMPVTGEVHMIPKSISFESLPQAEFNEIFETMLNVICERWLTGTAPAELRREAYAMMDGPQRVGDRKL